MSTGVRVRHLAEGDRAEGDRATTRGWGNHKGCPYGSARTGATTSGAAYGVDYSLRAVRSRPHPALRATLSQGARDWGEGGISKLNHYYELFSPALCDFFRPR